MSEGSKQYDQSIRDSLRLLYRNLRIVHSGILVAVTALDRQNADRDDDIARTLEHLVGDRLAAQIELTANLMTISTDPDPLTNEPYTGVKPREVRESKLLAGTHSSKSIPH